LASIFLKHAYYRPKKEIITAALARIGEKGYDLVLNNCQHFCSSVRYGVEESLEVEESTFFN